MWANVSAVGKFPSSIWAVDRVGHSDTVQFVETNKWFRKLVESVPHLYDLTKPRPVQIEASFLDLALLDLKNLNLKLTQPSLTRLLLQPYQLCMMTWLLLRLGNAIGGTNQWPPIGRWECLTPRTLLSMFPSTCPVVLCAQWVHCTSLGAMEFVHITEGRRLTLRPISQSRSPWPQNRAVPRGMKLQIMISNQHLFRQNLRPLWFDIWGLRSTVMVVARDQNWL